VNLQIITNQMDNEEHIYGGRGQKTTRLMASRVGRAHEEAMEADKAPKRPQKLRQLNDLFARPTDLEAPLLSTPRLVLGALLQRSPPAHTPSWGRGRRCRLREVRSLALRPRLSSVRHTTRRIRQEVWRRCAFIGFQLKSLPYFATAHQGLLNPVRWRLRLSHGVNPTRARSRAIRSTRCSSSWEDSRPSW